MSILKTIADELKVRVNQVEATVNLLDGGSTVPFISRYRKEVTGGLDDTQLRQLEERLTYLRELESRRETILASIESQGKLSDELKVDILNAENKARLEDLYLPYKPKRRTKAQLAREAGLEPLASELLDNPAQDPKILGESFIAPDKGINTSEEALEGARQILMEKFSEDADLLKELREKVWSQGLLSSQVLKDKEEAGVKFKDYFSYQEPLNRVPSHRALAVFRGQNEGFLSATISFIDENHERHYIERIANYFSIDHQGRPADEFLRRSVEMTWKVKLKLKIELDLMLQLREMAETEAIKVFKENLKNLLMAAPAGAHVTMGLDPGFRTGVKVVVIDETGKLLAHTVIFPHAPQARWDEALQQLSKLAEHFKVTLISIGNGTASRETDRLAIELIKKCPKLGLTKIVVSEAGASVYSASELAAHEFPDLDVSYRGAVSIARRLQDPLAELVKIDPKSIGVGQYQHDVNQSKLGQSLNAVLEDCVNAVGADVNTASVPLLKSIAGLNESLAKNMVSYREANGAFVSREAIKKVPRMGDKTFEQAIGFLRIIGGKNPLDASAVHPEAYPVVKEIEKKSGYSVKQLMGNQEAIRKLNPHDFVSDQFGLPTIKDIFKELAKPGRDPRPEFKTAQFHEGIENVSDLKPGMSLEGVVTNVTKFGAFVDIGVHQDGLVHVSHLANHFVSDPSEVVKVGQIVKVKVLEIDVPRKRIQLSMRDESKSERKLKPTPKKAEPRPENALGSALANALKRK